ncbi:unnamed protein product [Closterium sp. Naga37s-1]|nr:unnamed protein product [Closterium sp. Naga37s-1]
MTRYTYFVAFSSPPSRGFMPLRRPRDPSPSHTSPHRHSALPSRRLRALPSRRLRAHPSKDAFAHTPQRTHSPLSRTISSISVAHPHFLRSPIRTPFRRPCALPSEAHAHSLPSPNCTPFRRLCALPSVAYAHSLPSPMRTPFRRLCALPSVAHTHSLPSPMRTPFRRPHALPSVAYVHSLPSPTRTPFRRPHVLPSVAHTQSTPEPMRTPFRRPCALPSAAHAHSLPPPVRTPFRRPCALPSAAHAHSLQSPPHPSPPHSSPPHPSCPHPLFSHPSSSHPSLRHREWHHFRPTPFRPTPFRPTSVRPTPSPPHLSPPHPIPSQHVPRFLSRSPSPLFPPRPRSYSSPAPSPMFLPFPPPHPPPNRDNRKRVLQLLLCSCYSHPQPSLPPPSALLPPTLSPPSPHPQPSFPPPSALFLPVESGSGCLTPIAHTYSPPTRTLSPLRRLRSLPSHRTRALSPLLPVHRHAIPHLPIPHLPVHHFSGLPLPLPIRPHTIPPLPIRPHTIPPLPVPPLPIRPHTIPPLPVPPLPIRPHTIPPLPVPPLPIRPLPIRPLPIRPLPIRPLPNRPSPIRFSPPPFQGPLHKRLEAVCAGYALHHLLSSKLPAGVPETSTASSQQPPQRPLGLAVLWLPDRVMPHATLNHTLDSRIPQPISQEQLQQQQEKQSGTFSTSASHPLPSAHRPRRLRVAFFLSASLPPMAATLADVEDSQLYTSLQRCYSLLQPSTGVQELIAKENMTRVQQSTAVYMEPVALYPLSPLCTGCDPKFTVNCTARRLMWFFLGQPDGDATVAGFWPSQALAVAHTFHPSRQPHLLRATLRRSAICRPNPAWGEPLPPPIVPADPTPREIAERGWLGKLGWFDRPAEIGGEGGGTGRHRIGKQLIVDDKVGMVYCAVQKVGCTSWKVWIRQQHHHPNPNQLLDTHLPATSNVTEVWYSLSEPDAIRAITRTDYTRFVFVRQPFTRIVSAYLNKHVAGGGPDGFGRQFWTRKYFGQLWALRALDGLRFRASEGNSSAGGAEVGEGVATAAAAAAAAAAAEVGGGMKGSWWGVWKDKIEMEMGHLLSFDEFVQLLGDAWDEDRRWFLDEHIAPQNVLCGLDRIRYDYVGRFESMDADVRAVMHHFGRDPGDAFDFGKKIHPTKSKEQMQHMFTNKETYDIVRRVYGMDMHAPFNNISYDAPEELQRIYEVGSAGQVGSTGLDSKSAGSRAGGGGGGAEEREEGPESLWSGWREGRE